MSDGTGSGSSARPKKKTASAFKRPPAGTPSVFDAVIAGASDVVANSFIAQGTGPSGPPSAGTRPAAEPTPSQVPPPQKSAPQEPEQKSAPASAPAQRLPETLASAPRVPRPESSAVAVDVLPEVAQPAEPQAQPPAVDQSPHPSLPAASPTDTAVLPDRPDAPTTRQVPAVQPSVSTESAGGRGTSLSRITMVAAVSEDASSGTDAEQDTAEEPAGEQRGSGLRSPMRRRVRRPGGPWAHLAVAESYADAVISSNTWATHGFRIVPEVLNAVKARLSADRRSSGNSKLAVGHYLDAALRHAPTEVDEQVASAQEFLAQRMGVVDSGRQSTYRVGPQALALATTLNASLQEADHARKGIFVVSAALESLLRSLDAEGEMLSPHAVEREG